MDLPPRADRRRRQYADTPCFCQVGAHQFDEIASLSFAEQASRIGPLSFARADTLFVEVLPKGLPISRQLVEPDDISRREKLVVTSVGPIWDDV